MGIDVELNRGVAAPQRNTSIVGAWTVAGVCVERKLLAFSAAPSRTRRTGPPQQPETRFDPRLSAFNNADSPVLISQLDQSQVLTSSVTRAGKLMMVSLDFSAGVVNVGRRLRPEQETWQGRCPVGNDAVMASKRYESWEVVATGDLSDDQIVDLVGSNIAVRRAASRDEIGHKSRRRRCSTERLQSSANTPQVEQCNSALASLAVRSGHSEVSRSSCYASN